MLSENISMVIWEIIMNQDFFYFVFKLPFLNMQKIFLKIFLLLLLSFGTIYNENRKSLILMLQIEQRKPGKRTLEF